QVSLPLVESARPGYGGSHHGIVQNPGYGEVGGTEAAGFRTAAYGARHLQRLLAPFRRENPRVRARDTRVGGDILHAAIFAAEDSSCQRAVRNDAKAVLMGSR